VKYPKISVIVPSYNQALFLERTICSIINQDYPNLELIVIDGGSKDGSLNIIEKYQEYIFYSESQKDKGQTNAINKGLKKATGEWVCWQNSDDIFTESSFSTLAKYANEKPGIDVLIGNINLIDGSDNIIRDIKYVKPTYRSILAEGMVLTNQAAFWKRAVHERIGYLAEDLHYGFDYEWFLRLLKEFDAHHVNETLGGYRIHGETKTSLHKEKFKDEYDKFLPKSIPGRLEKKFFLFRRICLLILNHNYRYVLRGFKNFLIQKKEII